MRWFWAALLGASLAWAAAAQGTAPDYEAWEELAARAETAVSEEGVSTSALETLRAQLADARLNFLDAEGANQSRIDTLRSQIDALGPAPAEGESEAPDLAARRAELNERLDRLQAPRRAATEAFSRAAGLIGEIDAIISDRETRELLTLGPSPLSPSAWPAAGSYLANAAALARREVARGWASPTSQFRIRENLPATIALVLIGLALLLQGRRLMVRLTRDIHGRSGAVGQVALGFLVSLGQIVLPILGIYVLTRAALSTELFGIQGIAILNALPSAALSLYGSLWLGARLFSKDAGAEAFLGWPLDLRPAARTTAGLIGAVVGAHQLLRSLYSVTEPTDEALAVLGFPLLVALGVLLWRLAALLRRAARDSEASVEDAGIVLQGIRMIGRLLALGSLVAVVLGALGYMKLGLGLVVPAAVSLGLLGALAALHGPMRDIYGLLTGKNRDEARAALVPVLASFVLFLGALPVFALIWGMRQSELGDLWTAFLGGVTLGETRISPSDFLTVIVVFLIGYGLTRLLQNTLKTNVLPRTKLDVGGRNAITSGVGYLGIFLAVIIAVTTAGINLSSLAIVAGALSVGIGFGLQNIVSNFVSGIILLIERPISEGDWIEVGGQMGYVRAISVRSTRIETFDRTDVIVPNADLVSGTVTNWTRGNTVGRAIIPVGVAYGTDTRKVEAILAELAEAHPMVASMPPPNVLFIGFGADSLDFEIRAILRDVNYLMITKSDLNHAIAARFAEEGIEIPFAQRDVWLRNPESLRTPGEGDA